MWGAITNAIGGIFGGWVDLKKAKYEAEANKFLALQKAEADWDTEALRQSQYSWKDEFIAIIWYSPLYVGWFKKDPTLGWEMRDASEWVSFVGQLPVWWQFGAFGIMAASFGLRWYFKQQDFKVHTSPKASQGNG